LFALWRVSLSRGRGIDGGASDLADLRKNNRSVRHFLTKLSFSFKKFGETDEKRT